MYTCVGETRSSFRSKEVVSPLRFYNAARRFQPATVSPRKFLTQDAESAYVYDGGVADSRPLDPGVHRRGKPLSLYVPDIDS